MSTICYCVMVSLSAYLMHKNGWLQGRRTTVSPAIDNCSHNDANLSVLADFAHDPISPQVMTLCARAGCDCACHTYCANLESIPEDEWYCHGCTEERERTNQGRLSAIIGNQQPGAAAAATPAPSRTPRRLTRAGADGQGARSRSTPGEVVDLITPEEAPVSEGRPRRRLRRLYRCCLTLK